VGAELASDPAPTVDDDRALEALSRRDWSPLGAIGAIHSMLRSIDVDRSEEAVPVLPMSTVSITEDMATAMDLHALGWRSVYHQEILAKGLAPEDLQSALQQRLRWAQGTIQVLLREPPMFKRGLSFGQRLMYTTTMWSYLAGFPAVVFLTGPALFLLFGVSPVRAWSPEFFWHLLPFLAVNQLIFLIVGWGRSTWRGQQYSLALFPLWIKAVTSAAGNVLLSRRLGFVVTPKSRQGGVHLRLVWPQLAAMALLTSAVVVGLLQLALGMLHDAGPTLINVVWACYDLIVLSVVLDAALYDPRRHSGALEPMRI
jgi:cellulose synthase (UDP-forming)